MPLPGHSLGGALAQLVAHEISTAAAAEGLYVRVVCYTFGAPRVCSLPGSITNCSSISVGHIPPAIALLFLEDIIHYSHAQVGNHAFAREFTKLVPHTWNIINHQVFLGMSQDHCMHCGCLCKTGLLLTVPQWHINQMPKCSFVVALLE